MSVARQICGNQMPQERAGTIQFMAHLAILEMLIFITKSAPMWQL